MDKKMLKNLPGTAGNIGIGSLGIPNLEILTQSNEINRVISPLPNKNVNIFPVTTTIRGT